MKVVLRSSSPLFSLLGMRAIRKGPTAGPVLRRGSVERVHIGMSALDLLAEFNGQAVGYLLYHQGYDVDRGGRILYVIDLFVREGARRHGAGRALMEAAAEICHRLGGRELFWSVYAPNTMAQVFYERLGAKYTKDLKFMHWLVATH